MPSRNTLVIELNDKAEFQKLLDGKPGTCGMRSGRVYLQPGESCGQHSTNDREEILIFLSGKGLALIGEKDSFEIGAGKVAYIPPRTIHNIKNTAAEPLIYIYCVNPVADM
jgi:mannose-6-phosphate isomerase-like protein (cupin superfamily)